MMLPGGVHTADPHDLLGPGFEQGEFDVAYRIRIGTAARIDSRHSG